MVIKKVNLIPTTSDDKNKTKQKTYCQTEFSDKIFNIEMFNLFKDKTICEVITVWSY